ncbi:MAG: heterodisulfide reductase-related iron-sulfur binding cluster [Chloroflexota bacterium]|nr:heterodisulfide reductase-related iron-sulfur binding cluster [Chloroflexota bacterium]
MEAFREIFGNIPEGPWVIYPLAIIAALIFLYAIVARFWIVGRRGQPEDRFHPFWRRIGDFIKIGVVEGLIHKKIFREAYPGIAHFLVFWGCIILLLSAAADFLSHYWFHWLTGTPELVHAFITDIGGIAVFVGAIIFIIRRYAQQPGAFHEMLDRGEDDVVALALILAVVITGFFVEAFRIAAVPPGVQSTWNLWSPGGLLLSKAFAGLSLGALLLWHEILWYLHVVITVGAVVYISLFYSKLTHIIAAPLNVFFRERGPKGALVPIDLEEAEFFGVGEIGNFTWKQLLDLDACTRCGRCQEVCPAYLSQQPLSPKKLIQSLKAHALEESHYPFPTKVPETSTFIPEADPPRALIGQVVPEDAIWSCCTCGACQEVCPVYIEHIDKIIDMRRNLVLERAKVPELAEPILTSIETRGHSCKGTTLTRVGWEQSLGIKHLSDDNQVDLVLWLGCQASLEDRSVKITQALAKILKAAGINFATLGTEESCCGEPARRMGNEYLFQMQAMKNIEMLKGYHVKKIVTACPHCFNTLKNEYPQFGGEFEVIHHSQFIAQLIREGSLKLTSGIGKRITYHDPCYLGRHNGIYEPPRKVLRAIPGINFVEMERHGWNSFCCGGGGGRFWVEEKSGERISHLRLEDIKKTNAEIVATACPYCLQMLEDAIKGKEMEESLQDLDIAELVELAIADSTSPSH